MDMYKDCAHIKRTQPSQSIELTPDLLKQIEEEARTLPTFEGTLYNAKLIKHYSLNNNELLKCRWQKFVDNSATYVKKPCQLADHRDLHFHNGVVRMMKVKKDDYKLKNIYGPGVDDKGQMPIPVERLMQRGGAKKASEMGKKVSKRSEKNDGKTDDEDNEGPQKKNKGKKHNNKA